MAADPIVELRAVELRIPLPAPLTIGPLHVADRRYTVVEITCESGLTGAALAQSRGAPVAEIAERLLAPALIRRDATAIAERWDEVFRATIAVGRVGLVLRAISLVDLALWDLAGKRAGAPIHTLLGAGAAPVRVSYVAGYPRERGDLDGVVERAVNAAADGHQTIKVARTRDAAMTRELLHRLDAALPDGIEVAVDANWVWRSIDEALAELGDWPPARLAWVEDPFVPEDVVALAALRRRSSIAVAAGDEVADPVVVRALIAQRAVDVLRLDVTTIGGISAARPLLELAEEAEIPVSFHVSPETSIHLATAYGICRDVETFDRTGNPFDPIHERVSGGPSFDGGFAIPSAASGLGFEIAAS